jgi:hypothetical protein
MIRKVRKEQWKQAEVRACGAVCPVPGCGALVIAYRPADSINELLWRNGAPCEFVCDQCGLEFTASGNDLVFQSIPRDWLLSGVCRA